MMGAALPPAPGVVAAACKFDDVREGPLLRAALGRLRNARHALELRHCGSSASLMARRYSSRPSLRFSRYIGLEFVFTNQDFPGRGAGGGPVTWLVNEEWKARNSE